MAMMRTHHHRGMTVPDLVATTSPHRQSQTRRRATDGGDGVGPSRQRRNLLPMSRRVRSSTTHWSSVTRSAIRNLATVGRAILRRASEGAEADLVGGTRMSVALGDAAALVERATALVAWYGLRSLGMRGPASRTFVGPRSHLGSR
jgi:hypothetical protein